MYLSLQLPVSLDNSWVSLGPRLLFLCLISAEYCLGSESFLSSSGILDLAPFFNPAAFIALTFSSPASFLQLFL